MIFHERTSTGESLLSYLVAVLPNWVTGVTVHIAIQQGHRTGGYGDGNGVPSLLVNWLKIDVVIYLIYFGGLDMYILPNPTRDHISISLRTQISHDRRAAEAGEGGCEPCRRLKGRLDALHELPLLPLGCGNHVAVKMVKNWKTMKTISSNGGECRTNHSWCTRFSRIYFIALQIASHLYNYCRFPPSGSGHLFSSTNEEVIQSPVGSNRFDFEVVPIEHSWRTADCMFGREILVVYGCFWLILIVEGRWRKGMSSVWQVFTGRRWRAEQFLLDAILWLGAAAHWEFGRSQPSVNGWWLTCSTLGVVWVRYIVYVGMVHSKNPHLHHLFPHVEQHNFVTMW